MNHRGIQDALKEESSYGSKGKGMGGNFQLLMYLNVTGSRFSMFTFAFCEQAYVESSLIKLQPDSRSAPLYLCG